MPVDPSARSCSGLRAHLSKRLADRSLPTSPPKARAALLRSARDYSSGRPPRTLLRKLACLLAHSRIVIATIPISDELRWLFHFVTLRARGLSDFVLPPAETAVGCRISQHRRD